MVKGEKTPKKNSNYKKGQSFPVRRNGGERGQGERPGDGEANDGSRKNRKKKNQGGDDRYSN